MRLQKNYIMMKIFVGALMYGTVFCSLLLSLHDFEDCRRAFVSHQDFYPLHHHRHPLPLLEMERSTTVAKIVKSLHQ